MKNDYKPIMIWYVYTKHMQHLDEIRKSADHNKLQSGYDILLFQVNDEKYSRVEIVSVDKSTIIEDIQKYIDLKFEGEKISPERQARLDKRLEELRELRRQREEDYKTDIEGEFLR